MDYNPPGSSVHENFQARILEWISISFSINQYYWWEYSISNHFESSLAASYKVKHHRSQSFQPQIKENPRSHADLYTNACVCAQLCLPLCDLTDCSPPGSSVHGISQTRILKWIAIPSPGVLPDPGIKPKSPALQADFYCWAAGETFTWMFIAALFIIAQAGDNPNVNQIKL